MERTAANVSRLETVWERAREFIPEGPAAGSSPEYDDHCRAWRGLVEALPLIHGFRIQAELPDIDEIGRAFLSYAEIGEPPFPLWDEIERPARELADYRYRLGQARRRAVRGRLEELSSTVSTLLDGILADLAASSPDPASPFEHPSTSEVAHAIEEIERLIGDAAERRGRWGDLHRHLRFSEPHDWRDIQLHDWPSVLEDIEAAGFAETDPLPVEGIEDLGAAAAGDVSGTASVGLSWDQLNDAGFERVLYDLLRAFPDHHNVQWLTKTNAPDRGRDLSLERALSTPTGETVFERVMVQAKHWLSRSIPPDEVAKVVAQAELWKPTFHVVIIATSGRFTNDAVDWADTRRARGDRPDVQLWGEADLERLLSRHPGVAAAHGLR